MKPDAGWMGRIGVRNPLITVLLAFAPGLFGIHEQLGSSQGTNVFRIQAGTVVQEVSITGR